MTDRRAARVAWGLSAGLHGLAVAGLWALVSSPPPAEPPGVLAFGLVAPDSEPPPVIDRHPPSPPTPPADPQPVAVQVPAGRPPVVVPVPAALPPTMAAFVRDRADRPAVEDVQDVTDVRQVAATEPAVQTPLDATRVADSLRESASPTRGASRPPERSLHGPLPAGRVVVYVVDCSGTMGLGGKLHRARAALLATLAAQPAGVRVLVVTYSGRAEPLTPGGPTESTSAVRERIADALAKLEPAGESRHAEGVRVAAKFGPDVVVLLTDADDAELAGVRAALAGARKPVAASAARVTADGVEPPRPVR
jgi:hypothetical protein